MNATRLLRAAEAVSLPRKVPFNRYKARKPWPPDFSKLDAKYQFRLERRYRRRSQLKWLRPKWVKGVKLAQWGICLSILGYGVMFMEWGKVDHPFEGIRQWVKTQFSSIWTAPDPQLVRSSFGNSVEQSPSSKPKSTAPP